MNNLTTRKIVLGMLMALVLAFSVQGIADGADLPLTKVSGDFQEKTSGNKFDITFTISQRNKTDIKNENGKLVTDGRAITIPSVGVESVRINRSGYLVMDVGTTEYRTSTSIPNTGYYRETSTSPWKQAKSSGGTLVIGNTNTNVYFVPTGTAKAYRVYNEKLNAKGTPLNPVEGNISSPLTADPNPPVPLINRYHYNEEKIEIQVVKGSGDPAIDPATILKVMKFQQKATTFQRNITDLTELPGSNLETLPRSVTLECTPMGTLQEGTYTVRIADATPVHEAPWTTLPDPQAYIEFTLRVIEDEYDPINSITADDGTSAGIAYLRKETNKKIKQIDNDFMVTGDNLEIRYKIMPGRGTLYAAVSEEATPYKGPNQDLTVHREATVFLNTNGSDNEIVASIAGSPLTEPTARIFYDYTGTDPASGTPAGDTKRETSRDTTPTVSVSPTSLSGAPGTPRALTISAGTTAVRVQGDAAFTSAGGTLSGTGTARSVTLPNRVGTYSLTVSASGYNDRDIPVTVTAAASTALGTLTVSKDGAQIGTQQQILVRASPAPSSNLPFTVNRGGFRVGSGEITAAGTGRAIITEPATGLYVLTVSATGYTSAQVTFTAGTTTGTTTTTPPTTTTTTTTTPAVAAEPSSLTISGPAARSGTVNEQLDSPLLVRVLGDNGSGVANARVIFRVISGRGRLSERGNGRAVGVQTGSNGYARANFTPTDGGSITVRASTDDISTTVTFTITTGAAPTTTRGPGTGVAPGTRSVSPVVHVVAASRPPMLWVDGGAIYALVGASPQRFAASVDNALNIAIGGGKVYWTEKTGESGGTINSANLNGSGVTELTSIKAVPMGIAVDVAGSKLYWTNSRGRIQSADLDGSGITNVMQNLPSPMDLALAGGNAYWTQGNGSVRFVNLRGQKVVRNVSTGTDTPGSLVIGGGKVYWTEMTGESGGTVNSANLNGTGATPLASILAAPMGIAVDGSRSKLYWSNSRGRIQSANLDGSGITNVVSGLGSPGDMVLSNSIAAPAATTTTRTTTTASNKYDVNGDGSVNNADSDAITVAIAAGATDAKYDVNGDGTVNVFDLVEIIANRDPGAAGAPTLFGMKMSVAQIDSLQEQIDLLIAMNDRSPAALRTLIYLQQLLVTARPEKTLLLANYPNPFNPETWIPYELATDTDVRLTIYNTQGVVIRTLQLGHQSAGYYTGRDRAAYWDGRNSVGEQVASGLYFYQFETDEMSLMRKMVILK